MSLYLSVLFVDFPQAGQGNTVACRDFAFDGCEYVLEHGRHFVYQGIALDQAIEWTVGHGRHTAFYFFTPLYAKGNRRTVQAWLDGKVRAQSLAQYHGDGPIIERIKTPPSFVGKHPEAASAPAVLIHTDIERLKRLNLRAFFLMLTGPFWLTTLAYLP